MKFGRTWGCGIVVAEAGDEAGSGMDNEAG